MRNKLSRINYFHVMIIMIMLLSALLLLVLATQKEGMHVDEYLTYGCANHEGYKISTLEYGVKVSAHDIYDPYFYTDDFSLKNIYLNLTRGTHPPIYYIFIHIFTIVTHHFLGLKTCILLNIMIHMVNIGLIWLIMKEMLAKEYEALFGTLLYAFLPIVLGNVLFIRMYVLASTFVMVLTLLFVKEWERIEHKKSFYVKLGVISVVGTLTHYYFLIYLFFSCMIWGIYIISKRKWSELIIFLGTMVASGAASIAIFPTMLQHLFKGDQGTAAFNSFSSSAVFIRNLPVFWKAIDNVYGGFLLTVLVVFVVVLVFGYINRKEYKWLCMNRWLILFFPCILYFLLVTKIAGMTVSRYISPVYAIFIILLMGLFDKGISWLTAHDYVKWFAGVLMVGILLNNGYKIYTWPELYKEAKACIETAKRYAAENECIYVFKASGYIYPSYQEFIQYRNMTFIRENVLDLLYTEDYSGYDHVVMYFDEHLGEEEINEILEAMIEMNPGLDGYKKLYKYYYNTVYYLE